MVNLSCDFAKPRDKRVIYLYEGKLLTVVTIPLSIAVIGIVVVEILFLICLVTPIDHQFKGLCNFAGQSPLG